jgi:UDP-N-acetylmuramate--alanine ligase
MKVLDYKLYYFLGIGGIGMSALARYFNHFGKTVHGYDKTSTALTTELSGEGITIHFSEDEKSVKELFSKYRKEEILVVYTPAVPRDHKEYIFVTEGSYTLRKRSEVLGEITLQFKTIAIAGTHGKTTTSSMTAHILKSAGYNCYAFLGGITKNYNTNLLLGDENITDNTYLVVEADEYDRSFLTLHPHIAVITSVDADHLDIYGDISHMHESYILFSKQVKSEGHLIVKKNVDNTLKLSGKRHTYAVILKTEYSAQNIRVEKADFYYDIDSPKEPLINVCIGLPGLHNVENSVAATAVAQLIGIKNEDIKNALRSFKGVKRRFDYRIKTEKLVYIDDYAHHPEELKAAIGAAKQLFPGKKITGIFQPHLFSRTRDFADGFAEALDLLDEPVLLEIYPAREAPIPGITSQMLLDKMKSKSKVVLRKEEVLGFLEKKEVEVMMTMGAGDIDTLVVPIENLLSERIK